MTVPQLPHAVFSDAPGVGHESSAHVPLASAVQLVVHVASRVWPAGQPSDVRTALPGAQRPSPVHALEDVHMHVLEHSCGCVPHMPHVPLRVAPGVHTPVSPMHGP